MGRKFGVSFSWKRAVGISGTKARISRKIGIPLTRQGRQRKIGSYMGCCVVIFFLLVSICLVSLAFAAILINFK